MQHAAVKKAYPWVICAAGLLSVFCTVGFCNNLFSVYLPYVQASGITSAQGSFIFTVRSATSLIAMLAVNVYFKKLNIRKGLVFGLLCALIAVSCYAVGTSPWMYYLGAVFSGFSFSLAGIVPVTLLIDRWFHTRRAFALGISSLGSGVATILFPPIVTAIAEKHGLRSAFLFQAAMILVCTILVALLVRNDPSEIGTEAFHKGSSAEEGPARGKDTLVRSDWILIAVLIICFGAAVGSALGHLSVLFTSEGYSTATAALMMSLFGLCQAIGKLAYGYLCDRIGTLVSSVIWMIMIIAGFGSAVFLNGHSVIPCILIAILFGLGFAPAMSGISLWAHDLADGPRYTNVIKWMQVLYSAGTILFSNLPGRIYAQTGEYRTSFLGMAGMALAALVMLLILYRVNWKRVRNESMK